jgi:thiol-disulfide isomerase/thioredoxin
VTAVSAPRRNYVPWIIGAAVVVVALVGAIVIAVTRSDDTGDTSAAIVETNAVVIEGAPLPELVGADQAVGATAPQATGTGFDGLRVELLEDGEPTVVGFFAHWCPVCQGEVDEISDHLDDVGVPDDVRIVAVSTGVRSDGDNYPPSAWFAREGWPAPVLLDDADGSLANAYGLPAFPLWVAVDADGQVAGRVSGAIGPEQFDALLDVARNGSGS